MTQAQRRRAAKQTFAAYEAADNLIRAATRDPEAFDLSRDDANEMNQCADVVYWSLRCWLNRLEMTR